MSDEKNEEAGKQEETELSEDQLEEVAGGDAASPKISPYYEELTGSEIYGKEIAQKVEGTGTVSEDGAEVVSDPGVGIVKGG